MGRTAPSCTGLRNLFECQLAASAPVSASPSPMTQQTTRSGLSNAAPYAWTSAYPSSPPSWIEPGVSGAAWLGMPPGNENWRNSRRIPSASGVMSERSEEHTSELQSRQYLVCRLLLEKKKKNQIS